MARRIVPQVHYDSSACDYTQPGQGCQYSFPTTEGPTMCIAADSLRFTYDAVGNLKRADNNWAHVERRFAPNGLVTLETQAIRKYGTSNPASCGGGDRQSIADLGDFSHLYQLSYEYDLAGRRTKLGHPDALDPCSGACQQTYAYDAVTGLLDTLRHPSASGGTLTTTFAYDNQLRLITTNHPGSVSTTQTYDHESRLLTRDGPRTNDSFTRDAAGRMIGGSVEIASTGASQAIAFAYSGMGSLQWAQGMAVGIDYEEYKTDALGNRLWVRDPDVLDAIDRTRYMSIAQAQGQLTGMELGTGNCGTGAVPHASCHPNWYVYDFDQSHDASGNVDATWSLDTRGTSFQNAVQVPDESRSYYAADETLVYQNRHIGYGGPGEAAGVFEEYRYDALGRRVLTRSRRPSSCTYPCEAFVARTVWDGSQVLYETRSSGGSGVDSSYFETDGSVAVGDDPNLYGIVGYAHAVGIDQPVGILKRIPTTGWAYVTPHANWKGDWSYGTFSDGTLCLTTGSTCPSWPGFALTMDRGSQGVDAPSYTVWWGDLIRGSTDGSGLVYQRNRYYDPKTGRFTQVDPTGLAAGMNLYGFAGGDPVNFSDPLGLCKGVKEAPTAPCEMIAVVIAESDGGLAGYRATASVIMNRAGGADGVVREVTNSGTWDSWCNAVCTTAMNYPSSGDRTAVVWDKQDQRREREEMFSASMFSRAAQASEELFTGKVHDTTHGANHMFRGKPSWAKKMRETHADGHNGVHRFFDDRHRPKP